MGGDGGCRRELEDISSNTVRKPGAELSSGVGGASLDKMIGKGKGE